MKAALNDLIKKIAYDPATGLFAWASAGRGIAVGKSAGCLNSSGYVVVKVNRQAHQGHRLAWFMTYGVWPDGEIDHINRDRSDNRIENLRVVDRAANSQNRWAAHRDHKSCGLLGVAWNKQHCRWQAKIVANKVRYHLGYFDDANIAHAAYIAAKERLHISGGGH